MFLIAVILLSSCTESIPKTERVKGKGKIFSLTLKNLSGNQPSLHPLQGMKGEVFVFLSPECPLCQGYTPLLRDILTRFGKRGFQLYAVFPGKDYSPAEIRGFLDNYKPGWGEVLDPDYQLTHLLGATITPEVFVVSAEEEVLYSGRLDDWSWDTGQKKIKPTMNDLMNALEGIDAGTVSYTHKTTPVGCLIEK